MIDPSAFEHRYRDLEASLGDLNMGEAIRTLAELPIGDEGWDRVISAELLRVVQLHATHYSAYESEIKTIRIGRNPVSVSTDRDLMMAQIGFVQGATFVVAALRERGRLT
jgi:hypothetical protein